MASYWNSICSMHDGGSSKFVEIFSSSSCINHIFVISVGFFFVILFSLNFVCKVWSSEVAGGDFRASSLLRKCSGAYNSLLTLVYLFFGLWMVAENLRGIGVFALDQWLLPLMQSVFTMLVVFLIVSSRPEKLGRNFILFWSIIAALFVGFICTSSAVDIFAGRKASMKTVLDILSLPGAILLLCCAFKASKDLDLRSLYEPLRDDSLNSNHNNVNQDDFMTPFVSAGILSKMSFWWLNPLMKKGYEQPLQEEAIPQLGQDNRAEYCFYQFLNAFNRQKESQGSVVPSTFWVLVSCYKREVIVSGLFALLKILTVSAGPVIVNTFIQVAQGNAAFKYEGYVLAFGLFFAKCLESLSQRQWFFQTRRLGLQVRSLLSAAIYQKQLKLSNSAKLTHSTSEIMNYVTVDAYRVDEFPYWFQQIWTTSLQLCIALVILYNCVGLATISAMIVIILAVMANAPLAKLQLKFKTMLMRAQDVRLKAVTEALTNMKVLKLYAWETHLKKVIQELRDVNASG